MGIATAANADATWAISAQQPCTGLTAGFARPLADLSDIVGPRWQPAPGPVKGQGLVLLFVTTCPNSIYAGKPTGSFSSAFVLLPVMQLEPAGKQTHAIAVLQAAGPSGTAVMNLFHTHGIHIMNAQVSLAVHDADHAKHAEVVIRTAQGTLTLDADLQPLTQPYKSTNTLAVRVAPAGALFNGPESSVRYAKGEAEAHTVNDTWVQRYQLEKPLFVTLDTDFIWKF
ncbi:MAG: hypothetical protein KGL98_02730, partial [Gammaproteobacteria bacterium]|nr:hypothetical protein [Gammaproteobacteria bacterium]